MFTSRSLFRSQGQIARAFSTTPARSLARMQIIGRLADTPESTPTSTGRDVIRYALGVSSGPRDDTGNRSTSWFRVASFTEGAQRDLLLSLPKGTLLYLDADARMDTFQDANGNNQTRLNLVQRNFETLSRPRAADDEAGRDVVEDPSSGLGAS